MKKEEKTTMLVPILNLTRKTMILLFGPPVMITATLASYAFVGSDQAERDATLMLKTLRETFEKDVQ